MNKIIDDKIDLLTINDDTHITFNETNKTIIKSTSNISLSVNSDIEIILLANKVIDIDIIVNRFCSINLTVISFNNKSINFNVELLDGSNIDSNFIVINKGSKLNINQAIKHNGRDSYSMVNNKAIAFNKSEINFNTTGIIKNGIKNCNCNQLTRGLILDSDATIKATPILAIDEFDVKAYHGATIGNVSDDDLFYLMSRGLTQNEAFNLVINGLFKPYFDKVFIEKEQKKLLDKYQSFFK